MILRAIESIRQKPKAVRQRYAFVTTVIFTAIVTGVWSLSLPARFTAVQEGVTTASPEITSQTASAPFSGVWSQFKQQVLGMVGKDSTAPTNESLMLMSTSSAEVITEPKDESVLLESGSTIRFGTQAPASNSPGILLGTTSTTSSDGQ
jgi:hypothetical protein